MLFTQSFMALTAVVLWVMWLTGVQSPWAIVGVVALGAVATGYNVPANQSLLTDLVPREALLSAVSLNGAQFNAGRAVGPALAGLVLAALGPSWAFALNAVSFGGLIGVLALIHIPSQGIRPDDRPPVMASYLQGVRGLWADPGMRLAYLLYVALAALGQPALQLIPVFAKKVFDVGAVGVGLLTASFGVGAVFGAVLLTWWRDVRRSRLVRWSYPFLGLGVTLFAISPNMAMAMAVLFPAGMANLVAAAGCNTTVHLRVPPAIRGRVMGFYLLGFTAAFPLSALIQGWLADLIGPQATVAISGGLLMTVGAILLLKPSLPLSMDGNIAVD
jgi:predicted MFS family arabinose efflux permease